MDFTFDDDNFDDAFFAEVDKLEILATTSTQQPPPQPPQHQQQPPPPPLQQSSVVVVVDDFHTHSPPRELSQRNPNNSHSISSKSICSPFSDEQFEIERLKNELSTVSKELLDLKQECSELKKQRDRDQQLNVLHSSKKSRTRKSEDHPRNGISPKSESLDATDDLTPSRIGIVSPERRSTGIQTDKDDESLNPSTSGATSSCGDFSKLLSIWSPLSSHRLQRNFVAKLLEACASEFCALFGCMGTNMSNIMDSKSFISAPMPRKFLGQHSTEGSKIAELYSVFTKLADDRVHINAFLEALLDLCSVENVLVVSRSLHILRVALEHMLRIDRTRLKSEHKSSQSWKLCPPSLFRG